MEIIETLKLLMKVVHKDRIMPRVKSFVSHAAQTYRDDIVKDIFSAVDFNIYGDDEEDNNNTVVKTRTKPRSKQAIMEVSEVLRRALMRNRLHRANMVPTTHSIVLR